MQPSVQLVLERPLDEGQKADERCFRALCHFSQDS
jgi:hypothetical protein